MKTILPFKALRYNSRETNLSDILCPPYDVIDEKLAQSLSRKSKYNSIHVSYNVDEKKGENKYKHIPKLIQKWKTKKILQKDSGPAFYFLEEKFKWKGKAKTRMGVFALVPVLNNENIVPHEKVFLDAVSDRLSLLKTTRTHISPIFLVSEDEKGNFKTWLKKQRKVAPLTASKYSNGGISYQFGAIQDQKSIKALQKILADQLLLIADGHHRYATAQLYSEQTQKEQYILAFIAPSSGIVFSHHEILSEILERKKVTTKQILKACKTGKLLPQKTTYFYPKVMTGFVFHEL